LKIQFNQTFLPNFWLGTTVQDDYPELSSKGALEVLILYPSTQFSKHFFSALVGGEGLGA